MSIGFIQNIGIFELLFVFFVFLVVPIGLIILAVRRPPENRMACPRCAEKIAVGARICRFCGGEVR